MITVREAVDLASEFGDDVFHKRGTIEEVEIDGKYLLITLGFEEIADPTFENATNDITKNSGLWEMSKLFNSRKREKNYKVFKIDGEEKKVLSAKIRNL